MALVDEYAHSNIPGSADGRRWRALKHCSTPDHRDLDTHIQHLRSPDDVVAQITGIEQRETVPDEVVEKRPEIELVDITPEALRRRLAHGNVYPSDGLTRRCLTISAPAT